MPRTHPGERTSPRTPRLRAPWSRRLRANQKPVPRRRSIVDPPAGPRRRPTPDRPASPGRLPHPTGGEPPRSPVPRLAGSRPRPRPGWNPTRRQVRSPGTRQWRVVMGAFRSPATTHGAFQPRRPAPRSTTCPPSSSMPSGSQGLEVVDAAAQIRTPIVAGSPTRCEQLHTVVRRHRRSSEHHPGLVG